MLFGAKVRFVCYDEVFVILDTVPHFAGYMACFALYGAWFCELCEVF